MIIKCKSNQEFKCAQDIVNSYASWLNLDLSFQDFNSEMGKFRETYGPPFGAFFIAEEDNKVVGGVGVRLFKEGVGEIKRLYVAEHVKGKGLGKKLVQSVITEAKAIGYKQLLLDTLPSMVAAQNLYKSFGFKPVSPYRQNPINGTKYMQLVL